MYCFLGLLQFRRPQRPLGNGAVEGDEDSDNEDDEERHTREEEMHPDAHSGTEEHVFEHLPPRLHRGIKDYVR